MKRKKPSMGIHGKKNKQTRNETSKRLLRKKKPKMRIHGLKKKPWTEKETSRKSKTNWKYLGVVGERMTKA